MSNNYTDEKDKHLKTRAGSKIEISKERKPGDPDFSGYCIRFSLDKTNESIDSNAYDWQFQEKRRFPMLFQHDKKMVVGHVIITEKAPDGWMFNAFFNTTPEGERARICVEHGDLDGISQGFYSVGEEVVTTDPDTGRIKEVKFTLCELFEVSIVVSPAHDDARILAVNKEREIKNKEMASMIEAINQFRRSNGY